MTRPFFGARSMWPAGDPDGIAGEWTDLLVGDKAATYANTDATVSATDDGGGYMVLSAADDGSAPADYPSRMQAIAWDLPGDVDAIGLGGWGAVFRLVLDTQPSAGTQFNAMIGFADGDPNDGATECLVGGIRYGATNPRMVCSSRGGGGADVESGGITVPATIGQVLITVDAWGPSLSQVGAGCVSADGLTAGNAVITKSDTSTYSGTLRVILAWGCDSIAASGAYTLRVRPQVLWYRLPA